MHHHPPMHRRALLAASLAIALTGCGKDDAPASAPVSAPLAAGPTLQAGPTADGNTLRLQGSMQVDLGQGPQTLQSFATVVDAQLGEKMAARLESAEGQKKLADANGSVQDSMGAKGTPKVTSSDLQDMANSMAGRTVYTSQAMHMPIINGYTVTLDARSPTAPGIRTALHLTLSDKSLAVTSAKLEFYPESKSFGEFYVKKLGPDAVTITKLERKDDTTFAMSGSFKATDLPAGVLAKTLKGQTLASIAGQFDFQEVPIRAMP